MFFVFLRVIMAVVLCYAAAMKAFNWSPGTGSFPLLLAGFEVATAWLVLTIHRSSAWRLSAWVFAIFFGTSAVSTLLNRTCVCFGPETNPFCVMLLDVAILAALGLSACMDRSLLDAVDWRTSMNWRLAFPLVIGALFVTVAVGSSPLSQQPVLVADAVVGQPVADAFFDSSDPQLANLNNSVVFLLRPGCEKCETLVQSEPFQRFITNVPSDRIVAQVSIHSDYLWTYELSSRSQGEISWHSRPG